MIRVLITSLLSIVIITLFGQTNNNQNENPLKIGFTFSPDYNYRFLTSDPSEKSRVDILNSYETPKMGISTGVSILYKIHKRFDIETGILYSNKGYRIKEHYHDVIDIETGEIGTELYSFKYSFNYIDIPLKINFYIIRRKLKWFFSTGISTNIFLNRKTTAFNHDTDETHTSKYNEGLSRLNIAILIGTGFDYNILDKWNIRIEPIYRQSITPASSYSHYKRFMYSIGINIGAYYKL